MPGTPKFRRDFLETYRDVLPDLTELCRLHEISLDLIERSHDLDELLERVLEEYERRLFELPNDALDPRRSGPVSVPAAKKLRALVMFASQAAALKVKASASTRVRLRARSLEGANARLEAALAEAEQARARLDGVLSAVDGAILILDEKARIVTANPAAACLAGLPPRKLLGQSAEPYLGGVPRGGAGEVTLKSEPEGDRVFLVARSHLGSDGDAEVVLLNDITERHREMERRHHLEKLGEVLRTLSILSHKINNPLTSLLGRAQLLRARDGGDPNLVKATTVIEESGLRIAELVRELAQVVKEGRQEAVEELLRMEGNSDFPEVNP